jgi:hypothetical protein
VRANALAGQGESLGRFEGGRSYAGMEFGQGFANRGEIETFAATRAPVPPRGSRSRSGESAPDVCASRVNGGLHACGNKLRLPRVRLEKQLLSWVHGILVGDDAGEHLLRAWRSWSGEKLPTTESAASAHVERLDELCDEISNLIDAIAHGALRSSPMLAQRLTETELRLAAEEERVALQQGVGAVSPPQSVRFYQRFVSTSAKRFKESARETRATLTELVGGGVGLMATEDRQELIMSCGLGSTTLPLAPLTRTLVAFLPASRAG